MAGLSAVSLGVALAWAAVGFWPVLPFAGLELAAFGAALAVSVRGNRYREVLSFDERAVRIEFGMAGRGARSSVELPSAWTKVELAPGANRNAPSALLLCCSGRRVRIARCLTDAERERLARRIRELLSAATRAPAAGAAQASRGI